MINKNTNKTSGNILVAAAIVIAALIIGGAVIFTNNSNSGGGYNVSDWKYDVTPFAAPETEEELEQYASLDFLRDVSEDDWIKGDINAPIKIIEFSDTECPFCARLQTTLHQVVEEYDGQVAWVYRHIPLPQLHDKAATEAHATECAGELGGNEAFWTYLDRIYEITPSNDGLDLQLLPEIAEFSGIDEGDFVKCLESKRNGPKVQEDYEEANKLFMHLRLSGIGAGSPVSVIMGPNGETIPVNGAQPISNWKKAIDELLDSE